MVQSIRCETPAQDACLLLAWVPRAAEPHGATVIYSSGGSSCRDWSGSSPGWTQPTGAPSIVGIRAAGPLLSSVRAGPYVMCGESRARGQPAVRSLTVQAALSLLQMRSLSAPRPSSLSPEGEPAGISSAENTVGGKRSPRVLSAVRSPLPAHTPTLRSEQMSSDRYQGAVYPAIPPRFAASWKPLPALPRRTRRAGGKELRVSLSGCPYPV